MYLYGIFLIAFSFSFYLSVWGYGSVNFEYIFYTLPTVMALAIIIPALTMRSFSEERKSGTEQLLLTSPISITKIVLGKFIAATLIVIITELCTLLYLAMLYIFGTPHLETAFVTLLGFLLLSMSYISFGMFASSITENQIIAGVVTIGFFIITWFLPNFSPILEPLSLINMFDKFPAGLIALEEVVRFVTFTLFFIILTIIVLQRKKSVK